MACAERCLTGLLVALVIFMVAAALRPPVVETDVARAVIDLPEALPRPVAPPDEATMALAITRAAPLETASFAEVFPEVLGTLAVALETPTIPAAPIVPATVHAEPVPMETAVQPVRTFVAKARYQKQVLPEPIDVALALAALTPDHQPARDRQPAKAGGAINPLGFSSRPSAHSLSQTFDSLGYDLKSVGGGDRVPRLFLTNVPVDMEAIPGGVQIRKTVFLKTVLPLILQVNEEIAQERRLLWRLRQKTGLGVALRAAERLWLQTMADRYDVDDADIDILLRKVDVIPPSLALAQAAEESGWGTSRHARDNNALFGEGILIDGKVMQIRPFGSLLEAVRGYARNLNSHSAYRDFRNARSAMRQRGQPLDGHVLAGFILRWSERGEDYIKTLRVIIAVNELRDLDSAELHGDLAVGTALAAEPAI